jgi:hypothetical protein
VQPLLEDALKSHGGKYDKGKDWSVFAVADGKLITGQVLLRRSSFLRCDLMYVKTERVWQADR